MLLQVLDAVGDQQTVIAAGQEVVVNRSGVIAAAPAQNVMEANDQRSGWWFLNTGQNPMFLNELAAADLTAYQVLPGGVWPPAGYPLSTGALSVLGTPGDTYQAREW